MSIRFVYKWRWVLKPFVSYHCWTKSWWEENGTFATAHFCVWLSSTMLLGKLVSFAGCKITRRYTLGTSLSLKRVRGWVSWLLLKYCIYCASAPFLYRESADSLISSVFKRHHKDPTINKDPERPIKGGTQWLAHTLTQKEWRVCHKSLQCGKPACSHGKPS